MVATSGALVNPSINAILALKLQLSFLFQIIAVHSYYTIGKKKCEKIERVFSLQRSEEAFFKSDALL